MGHNQIKQKNKKQNKNADGPGTWYVALWMWALPSLHKWWFLVDLDLLYGKVKLYAKKVVIVIFSY